MLWPVFLNVSVSSPAVAATVLRSTHLQRRSILVVDRQISELRDGFPWESLERGKVVDVGGGSGHVSISLARVRFLKPAWSQQVL
jgi:2-polyprenyl-3-methyl-5-hydroxy-6-metoxy-1,4-benzoquinol methylase